MDARTTDTTMQTQRGPRLHGVPVPPRMFGLGAAWSRPTAWCAEVPVGTEAATDKAEAGNGPLEGSAPVITLVVNGSVDPASRAKHRHQAVAAA